MVFIFWLTLIPLIVWSNMYEGAKIVWFLSGGFFLTIFWINKFIKEMDKIKFSKANLFYLLWLLILLIASLKGVHPLESIVGGSYRHQGVLFFLVVFLVGKTIELLSDKQRKSLVKCVALVTIIETAAVLLQITLGKTYFGRPPGTLGEANAASGFIAMGSVFVFALLKNKKSVFVGLFILLAIIFSDSRTGFLMFLVVCLGVAANRLRKIKLITYLFLLPIVIFPVFVFFTKASVLRPESKFENRALFWKMGLMQFGKSPFLGYGAESGEVIYDQAFEKAEMPLLGMMVDRSHNLIIDIILWSGILGLIPFSLWFYQETKNLLMKKKYLSIFALTGWLIFSFLQPLGVSHWIMLLFILRCL